MNHFIELLKIAQTVIGAAGNANWQALDPAATRSRLERLCDDVRAADLPRTMTGEAVAAVVGRLRNALIAILDGWADSDARRVRPLCVAAQAAIDEDYWPGVAGVVIGLDQVREETRRAAGDIDSVRRARRVRTATADDCRQIIDTLADAWREDAAARTVPGGGAAHRRLAGRLRRRQRG